MDSEDLFRKLTSGVTFNVKKFANEAQKFQLLKPKTYVGPLFTPEKKQILDDVKEVNIKFHEDESENGDGPKGDNLKILGALTSSAIVQDKSKKAKMKENKKKTKMKLASLRQEEISRFRNINHIHVWGCDIPEPIQSFDSLESDYGVSSDILKNVKSAGYEVPTAVQMQAMPVMLHRREVFACAPTGSGKTAAFLLPILHHLQGPQRKGFRAVIVSPTRELARQTYRECVRLAEGRGLRVHIISKVSQAAAKFGPQSAQKFDILVTTPNRLVYLLKQEPPVLTLKNVEWLVVDESDKLFEAGPKGFREQLAQIYKACDSSHVRRAFFSATHTPDVEEWCKLNLDSLVTVSVGVRNAAADIVEQELLFVGNESGKLLAFRDIVRKGLSPPVLVFVQSKERAKELFNELIYDGINVDVIHADRTQLQRDNVVKSFRCGNIWVLICTELMGRGIDFKGVNLVVNYDFPPSAISYVHRIGRTGRAGRPGKAVTFFTSDDVVNLRMIAQVMRDSGCAVPDYMLHLKRLRKDVKKRLAQRAPKRDQISTVPQYDINRKEKLKKMIEKTKLKKKKATEKGKQSEKMGETGDTEEEQQKRKTKRKVAVVNGGNELVQKPNFKAKRRKMVKN